MVLAFLFYLFFAGWFVIAQIGSIFGGEDSVGAEVLLAAGSDGDDDLRRPGHHSLPARAALVEAGEWPGRPTSFASSTRGIRRRRGIVP